MVGHILRHNSLLTATFEGSIQSIKSICRQYFDYMMQSKKHVHRINYRYVNNLAQDRKNLETQPNSSWTDYFTMFYTLFILSVLR